MTNETEKRARELLQAKRATVEKITSEIRLLEQALGEVSPDPFDGPPPVLSADPPCPDSDRPPPSIGLTVETREPRPEKTFKRLAGISILDAAESALRRGPKRSFKVRDLKDQN